MADVRIDEFLLARNEERRALARAATPGPWVWENEEFADDDAECPHGTEWTDHGPALLTKDAGVLGWQEMVIGCTGYDSTSIDVHRADAEFIVANNPAVVLAHCNAMEECVKHCAEAGLWGVLRDLAVPYRKHPDWKEAWRPR